MAYSNTTKGGAKKMAQKKEKTTAEVAAEEVALIAKLEIITTAQQMDTAGFICLDQRCVEDPTEDPNVWVWVSNKGMKVLMYDDGGDNVSFVSILRRQTQADAVKHFSNFSVEDLHAVLV